MAKKKKIVGIIGLNGEKQDLTKVDEVTQKAPKTPNIIGTVDVNGNITRYTEQVNPPITRTHAQEYNLNGTKKIPITVSMTNNNIINAGQKNKLNEAMQNNITQTLINGKNENKIDLSGKSYIKDTGKTYGDVNDNLTENQGKKLYYNEKSKKYFINDNGKYVEADMGEPTNVHTMSAASSVNNETNKLIKKISKKTGYSEEEVTGFINDYNNAKWDNTSPKYRIASDKFKEAGMEVYEAAKQYDKYKPTFNKKLSPIENVSQSSINALTETGKGILDFAEGTSDALLQMGSSKYNPGMWIATGETPWSKEQSKLDRYQNIAKEIIGADSSEKALDVLGYNNVLSDGRTVQQTLDNGALIKSTNMGGKAFRSIGAQLPGLMTGSEAQSLALMGVNSFGSGVEEAYNNGGNRGQATGYGLLNSAIEVATEKIFAGVGGVIGKGEIDDAIINGINKKIKSELGQKLVSFGVKSLGEGTEEIIGDLLQPLAKKLTYASKEDLKKLYKDQNYLEDFILGSLSAAIMQGSTIPINNSSQNAIKDSLKGKVTIQNAIETFEQIKEQNEGLSDWEVANIVNNALKETNQNTVNFSQNSNAEQQNKSGNINNTIEQNSSEKLTKKEIQSIAEEVNNQKEKKLTQTVDMPKSESKINAPISNNFINSVKQNNINFESEEIKSINRTLSKRGIEGKFDSTPFKNSSEAAMWTIDENGKRSVIFNPKADEKTIFQNVAVHELTHDLLSNKNSAEVLDKQDILEYVSKTPGYDIARKSLEEAYSRRYDKNSAQFKQLVDEEVVASVLGSKLGNQEFINRLNGQKPNLAKRIYNWVLNKIDTLNKIVGHQNEKAYWRDVANRFEKAFNMGYNNSSNTARTMYATVTNNPYGHTKEFVKMTQEQQEEIHRVVSPLATKYAGVEESYSTHDINGNKVVFDILEDATYRITSVEKTKDIIKEVANETNPNTNSKHSMASAEQQSRYSGNNNESNRNNGTSQQNANIPTREQIKSQDRVSNKTQERNNKELDSSFSYRGSHQIENAKSIADLDLDEVKNKILDIDGYLTNQASRDFNKLKKIVANPNETVKIYRAAPVNELNNGDWVTTDKAYAKNVADNNGGKVYTYEVRADQLYYPDNIKELPSLHRLSSFQYIDNTNPTTNDDIRFSKNSKNWNEFVDKNFKSEGTKTTFGELKIPIAKDFKKEIIRDKVKTKKNNNGLKSARTAAKIAKNKMDLSNNEKNEFRKELMKYKGYTKEKLTNAKTYNEIKNIVKKYSDREISYINREIQDVKDYIKNTKLEVTQELKNSITDYNDFRKSNFGKLKLSNEGMSIDSFYEELSQTYPGYFNNEISTNEDRLYAIADFMNEDSTIIEKYSLDDKTIDDITAKVFNTLQNNAFSKEQIEEFEKEISDRMSKISRKSVREMLQQQMGITSEELSIGKDIKSLNYQMTDPIRVNEKVFGRELGDKINNETIRKTTHNEARKVRWLNSERNDIKKLGIKPRSKESAAVQKYGEKQYLNKYGELVKYGDKELNSEFPNVQVQEKIKKAAEVIRNKYDKYIDQINETLTSLGYDAIPKRADYMRHFQELGDIFSKTGVPFNLNDMRAEDLPTDINGLTEFNKPGKNYFASAQKRIGQKTTYDAITGIDGYLEGAGNLIYHTADIQRYRALSSLIRDSFGSSKGFDNLGNLTDEQAEQRVNDILDNKLSRYAAWLDEQANNLAGKKGAIDRGVERFLGRKVYTGLNTIKKQVGSNMTGFNVRSALTNLISSTIASAKTNKLAFVKGTASTIRNMFKNDGFIDKSDFLTTRFGSDQLSKKAWQKASNAGQIFMTGTDYFTANQITRSKYYEGLQKGMSESEAIKYADDFASRVMGDRSLGRTAEAFNSKTLGLLTQFQLEVNNQWQYMIHDTKMDYQKNSEINGGLKAGATALFQMGQLAAFSYFFNELFETLTGSRAAFDPIDILKKLFGSDDDKDKPWDERISEANKELFDNIPFGNLFTGGGRIPISEAFKGTSTFAKKMTGQKNQYGGDITWEDVGTDVLGSLPYYLLPTGYSQAKKTIKGLSMFSKDKEIKGSYTKSGRLRFPVKDTVSNRVQAGMFGEYSSSEARKYFNEGRTALTENQQNEYKTLKIPISDYWKAKKEINAIKEEMKGKTAEARKRALFKYIDGLSISKEKKAILKKLQYKSYTSFDGEIREYINSSNMSKQSKKNMLEKLGLD